MFEFDLDKMLFNIPAGEHDIKEIKEVLKVHPEVKFVSLVGLDIGGHDTDEKIPVKAFTDNIERFLEHGVQTDGSSVVLPKIADLNNAKVDIIPDVDVNWYVDHNLKHIDLETGLPVGTLRIPSFLLHNDVNEVGSRVILRDSVVAFKKTLMEMLKENPYVFDNMDIKKASDIEDIVLTSATELEFWVKTPDEEADREQLTTAQILKEQYWKRTIGPVRTALEKSIIVLDKYGFEVEMGHKEVGGVKAKMGHSGHYDHVMEELEVDWKYSTAMQAADNENQVKYVIRDVFRMYGLDVTFTAKPMEGIAGSGEHTHIGVAAKLKNGKTANMFSPKDMSKDFLSPVGFGALMGILKNYEVINPFVSSSNDSLNRLKPGYEAPVSIVTSLGHEVDKPSRNRTVLTGLVRDINDPLATRFELRSPNPKSNTYLVLASSYMAMLDGIKAALENKKTSKDLENSISKNYGQKDFYLEKERVYRTEKDVFDEYTPKERDKFFGKAPRTVWENLCAFEEHEEKTKIFRRENVMDDAILGSYREAILGQWATELHNRIIPNTMNLIRSTVKCHNETDSVDYDVAYWGRINKIRNELGRDTLSEQCLLTKIVNALERKNYKIASSLQIKMQKRVEELVELYTIYKKNLF
ncbi:MAG: glutamine synthetase [Eubacteriales bacterium]|nr:glutamine synthetase [Eubacteriales bacterium]